MVINIGFGNLVNSDRILAVVRPDAAPVKRMITKAKTDSRIIDATQGRKTKSVIILDEGYLLLSALQPDTISKRFKDIGFEREETESQDE